MPAAPRRYCRGLAPRSVKGRRSQINNRQLFSYQKNNIQLFSYLEPFPTPLPFPELMIFPIKLQDMWIQFWRKVLVKKCIQHGRKFFFSIFFCSIPFVPFKDTLPWLLPLIFPVFAIYMKSVWNKFVTCEILFFKVKNIFFCLKWSETQLTGIITLIVREG